MKTIITCLLVAICTFCIAQSNTTSALEELKANQTLLKNTTVHATAIEGVAIEEFQFESGAFFKFYTVDSEANLKNFIKKWNNYPVVVLSQERLEKRLILSNDIDNLMQGYKQKGIKDSIIIAGYQQLVAQLDTTSQLQSKKISLLETQAEELTKIANKMNTMLEESNKSALKIERRLRLRNVLNNILAGVGGLGLGVLIAGL